MPLSSMILVFTSSILVLKSTAFSNHAQVPIFRSSKSFLNSLPSFRQAQELTVEETNVPPPRQRNLLCRSRRTLLGTISGMALFDNAFIVQPSHAKCTNLESCREEGERKIEEDLKKNPIVKLPYGVRYRVLRPPTTTTGPRVTEGSSVDLAYSITTAAGQYMYSKGMGFERVEFGGKQESDLGLDSIRVVVGKHSVPVGIESVLIGMGKGERRRVELPPGVGFETSNWQPEPQTIRGKTQIERYKVKLTGFGSQPPFPAETVWDVEVLGVRN